MLHRGRGRTLRVVTHDHDGPASAATGHAPPVVAALAGAFLVLCTVLPLLVVARSAWRGRRALRGCPVCGGSAVRDGGAERSGIAETTVALQCGQCCTWRRLVVNENDERAHVRRLKRDQRQIRRLMLRLEAERRAFEVQAFIALLRSQIVGAQDFLAATRPPARARRAPRPRSDR